MTIENFVVHPERGTKVRTEVDLLAARFKYRSENVDQPMEDDPQITECQTLLNIILAEIKRGIWSLNGPWTEPEKGNMQRVLRAIGCAKNGQVETAAEQLYQTGRWANETATVRLFSLGEQKDPSLIVGLGQQIEWGHVIDFCIKRFRHYRAQKMSIGQWTTDGITLREFALLEVESSIRSHFGLNRV